MQIRTIGTLRGLAGSATEIRALISGIDKIFPLLVRIPADQRFRSIVADDAQIEGELFSTEAFAAIRTGAASFFPVGGNTVAIDGRKIRAFEPVWAKIVEELGLAGEDKRSPVKEITSISLDESIDALAKARSNLIDVIPGSDGPPVAKKKSGILGWLLLGAAAVYIKTKVA